MTQPLPPPTLQPLLAPAPAFGTGRGRGRRHAALEVAQVGVRVTDGLEARGGRLGVNSRKADENAELIVGPAPHQRCARARGLARVAVAALQLVVEAGSGIVERTCRTHVDRAGRAAFDLAGHRRLAHVDAREQLRREEIEVEFPVLPLAIHSTGRGDAHRRTVDRSLREIRIQPADRDVETFARHFTGELDAGNTIQSLGNVQI